MKEFTNRLIALRKENHLTQEDVAKIIQRKRSTVSGYESLDKEPDLETVCILAKYFGVTTDYLLGYSDHPTPVEHVFYGDSIGFEKALKKLPVLDRQNVEKCFNDFYQLLFQDVKCYQPVRLALYGELLQSLCKFRSQIRKKTDKNPFSDPTAISDLMALQSQSKSELASILDRMMQADLEVALKREKGVLEGLSERRVI